MLDTEPQVLPQAVELPSFPSLHHAHTGAWTLGAKWAHAHQQCHPEVVSEFTEGQDGYWPLVSGALERKSREGSEQLPVPTSLPLIMAFRVCGESYEGERQSASKGWKQWQLPSTDVPDIPESTATCPAPQSSLTLLPFTPCFRHMELSP
jgi:hypothetical protein